MIRQVQPRRRSCSSIRCSVVGSSALVASSRIRIGGIGDQGASDLEALALAAAEVSAALLHRRAVAPVAGLDDVVDRGVLGGAGHARHRDGRVPHRDVVADGAAEEEDVLIDRRHRVDDQALRKLGPRHVVEQHLAVPRLVEAGHQLRDRALAAAAGAHQRDPLPGLDGQVEALDQRRFDRVVAEGDVAQLDLAVELDLRVIALFAALAALVLRVAADG